MEVLETIAPFLIDPTRVADLTEPERLSLGVKLVWLMNQIEAVRLHILKVGPPLTSNAPVPDDRLLTVQEAARLLGQSVSWVYKRTQPSNRLLPVTLMGSSVRFRRSDLLAYIETQKAKKKVFSPRWPIKNKNHKLS
jgi:excisionase family DNA binding protein